MRLTGSRTATSVRSAQKSRKNESAEPARASKVVEMTVGGKGRCVCHLGLGSFTQRALAWETALERPLVSHLGVESDMVGLASDHLVPLL